MNCPICGVKSTMVIDPRTQVFCTNESCVLIFWDPSVVFDLATAERIDLGPLL